MKCSTVVFFFKINFDVVQSFDTTAIKPIKKRGYYLSLIPKIEDLRYGSAFIHETFSFFNFLTFLIYLCIHSVGLWKDSQWLNSTANDGFTVGGLGWLLGVDQRELDPKVVIQGLSVHVTVRVKDGSQGQHVLGLLAGGGAWQLHALSFREESITARSRGLSGLLPEKIKYQ